jgi:hypothetical protein
MAPQPPHRTCDACPAMDEPPPVSSFSRYSSKSRSTTFSSSSDVDSAMTVECPQYGHFNDRVAGSNSIFAPQLAQGKSLPLGGALLGEFSGM